MLIDWFTVGAQTLNFLVLVWLMKRFLYQPILHAIDAREKRIAAELGDAAAKKAEAQQERDEFQQKNQALAQQRAALLEQAIADAQAERQRLINEAKQAADALSAQRLASLRSDAKNLKEAIRNRTQQEVFAIVRKVLADLADTALEAQLCGHFIRRLHAMDAQDKAVLAEAIKTASEPALLRSAFALPETQREAIQQTLNDIFSTQVPLNFASSAELVAGIELSVNGQKVAWSVADYLGSMELAIDELVPADAKQQTNPNPE
ncbi:MAG: F0F1 ATP synthase subunit B [Methylovulum sp.]|uniref:F0F1 ATP synthase subunit B family protein n=1 Tax=Methylovulum sp. TaxID=1916980 RepID=UPI00260F5F32|nr:F0F1 ATP synthase subunit B [Methylovulum sp.]MDD2722637.1 F0F1 ATP synthase subunit B [Methylovulum sp.]MDD5123891.1 F0F1 ATP synthase subunit B [Methylovulum sp.]